MGNFLKSVPGLPISVLLLNLLERTAGRAIETELMADIMMEWLMIGKKMVASGDLSTWTDLILMRFPLIARVQEMAEAPKGAIGVTGCK